MKTGMDKHMHVCMNLSTQLNIAQKRFLLTGPHDVKCHLQVDYQNNAFKPERVTNGRNTHTRTASHSCNDETGSSYLNHSAIPVTYH